MDNVLGLCENINVDSVGSTSSFYKDVYYFNDPAYIERVVGSNFSTEELNAKNNFGLWLWRR